MRWEWNAEKARSNVKKHKVSFELVELALSDPLLMTKPDLHPDGDRWRTLAEVNGVLLYIVNTWPASDPSNPVGRIISARRATANERRNYEEGTDG